LQKPLPGLTLLKGQTARADLYLKGYFSVPTDENPGSGGILYVFDVLDQFGSRLHRITGRYALHIPPATKPERFSEFVRPDWL